MSSRTPTRPPRSRPAWVDARAYPFEPRFFETGDGSMHYVDEGTGPPVVLVHGTPTWSFLYRHLVAGLSRTHRVIAPDHLGFGLSDKPEHAPYKPADHARRLTALIEHLGLRGVTLGVHDFGGPIGLSYAVAHAANVRALVLFNTWMWSLAGDRNAERASRMAGGALGSLLYRRFNVSPRVLLPMVMGDRRKLTPEVHRHYVRAFPSAKERMAPWVLARELAGSADWYGALWERRDALVGKPALVLWGMKDPTFGAAALARWESALPGAEVVRFPRAGHLVQEEEGESLVPRIESLLARVSATR